MMKSKPQYLDVSNLNLNFRYKFSVHSVDDIEINKLTDHKIHHEVLLLIYPMNKLPKPFDLLAFNLSLNTV